MRHEWSTLAVCADLVIDANYSEEQNARAVADLFYPEPRSGRGNMAAKAICARCKCRAECLEFAIENDERFGVWGGMGEEERKREIERRSAARKRARA